MFFRLIFSFSPDYPRWIVGAFLWQKCHKSARRQEECTENQRRCPTEKRQEQERRCGGNGGKEQERGKPTTLFLRKRKSKKWYIKVVT